VGRRGRAYAPCSTLCPRGDPSSANLTQVSRLFHRGGIFIPALHRCGRARSHPWAAAFSNAKQWNACLECSAAKRDAFFGKEDNEYHLAACLLAFGSVIFTASSQAIHRETK
jgi:hypothetical protein